MVYAEVVEGAASYEHVGRVVRLLVGKLHALAVLGESRVIATKYVRDSAIEKRTLSGDNGGMFQVAGCWVL